MKKLTPKSYWDENTYNTEAVATTGNWLTKILPQSFYTTDIHHILHKRITPGSTMLEIGVAPGLNSIALAKEFGVIPYGVDYSEKGVKQAKKNFAAAGFDSKNVFLGDMFDSKLRAKHNGKYDIVTSWGLIEHFGDIAEVVQYHSELLRPGGLLVLEVPNIRGVNAYFCRNIDGLYNKKIMSLEAFTATIPKNIEIVEQELCGGIFNWGLFFARPRSLEMLRLVAYGIQRITSDQFQKLLLFIGVRLKYKYTTPCMIIIGRKHAAGKVGTKDKQRPTRKV